MAKIPELKDWREALEGRLKQATYTEEDIVEILYYCHDLTMEIQPVSQWLGLQQGFISQMQRVFNEMYMTRFNRQPPPRPTQAPVKEIVLDTPELRKDNIRQVALSLAEPGGSVSDEAILEELKRRGMRINLINPTATISTILRGFKPQFEKVEGKRGVFTRRE